MQMQRLTSVQDCKSVTLCLGDVKWMHMNVNTEAFTGNSWSIAQNFLIMGKW